MQPIPGLDPQPQPVPKPRAPRVIGVHIQGTGIWRISVGLLIVGWGLLRMAVNLGWDPAYGILEHWYFPGALTVIGLVRVLSADSTVGRGIGGLLAGLGAWWLVSESYGVRFDISDWWPLVLVVIGLLIIARAWDGPAVSTWPGFPGGASAPFAADTSSEAASGASAGRAADVTDAGPVSAVAFWSGVKRRVSAGFRRANVAAFMGGIELDLRPAIMVGGRAEVEVFVLMGGVEITVPPGWNVANEALVIMGGVDDRSSGPSGATQTLLIKGFVLMGGVEIKT